MYMGRALLVAGALLGAHDLPAPARAAAPSALRVVLVVDDSSARRSLVRGATLGAEEAARTGALFQTPVTLRIVTRASFESIGRAAASRSSRADRTSLYIV